MSDAILNIPLPGGNLSTDQIMAGNHRKVCFLVIACLIFTEINNTIKYKDFLLGNEQKDALVLNHRKVYFFANSKIQL